MAFLKLHHWFSTVLMVLLIIQTSLQQHSMPSPVPDCSVCQDRCGANSALCSYSGMIHWCMCSFHPNGGHNPGSGGGHNPGSGGQNNPGSGGQNNPGSDAGQGSPGHNGGQNNPQGR